MSRWIQRLRKFTIRRLALAKAAIPDQYSQGALVDVDIDGPIAPRYIGVVAPPQGLDEEIERLFGHRGVAPKERIHVLGNQDILAEELPRYIYEHIPIGQYEPPPPVNGHRLPENPWE